MDSDSDLSPMDSDSSPVVLDSDSDHRDSDSDSEPEDADSDLVDSTTSLAHNDHMNFKLQQPNQILLQLQPVVNKMKKNTNLQLNSKDHRHCHRRKICIHY